jgi:hypothetical protein
VFIPTRVLFDHKLTAVLRDTLAQLMALAWSSQGHELPPLSFDKLARLMGKSVDTLHVHFAVLRVYHSALRMRGTGNGLIIVTLADWLYDNKPVVNSRFLEIPAVKESDQESDQEDEDEDLPPHPPFDPDQSLTGDPAQKMSTEPTGPETGASVLPDDLADELIEAGVFSFLLPEVARAGWEKEDLFALLAWCEEDSPAKPGGLFMARLRKGAIVPEHFYGERCPQCRRVGKHAPDCGRRYLEGLSGGCA